MAEFLLYFTLNLDFIVPEGETYRYTPSNIQKIYKSSISQEWTRKDILKKKKKYIDTLTLEGSTYNQQAEVSTPWGGLNFKNMITELPASNLWKQSCQRKSSLFEATLAESDRSDRREERWHEFERTWICYEADSGCQVGRSLWFEDLVSYRLFKPATDGIDTCRELK